MTWATTAATTWTRVVGSWIVHTIMMIAGVSPCAHVVVVVVVVGPAAGTTAIIVDIV